MPQISAVLGSSPGAATNPMSSIGSSACRQNPDLADFAILDVAIPCHHRLYSGKMQRIRYAPAQSSSCRRAGPRSDRTCTSVCRTPAAAHCTPEANNKCNRILKCAAGQLRQLYNELSPCGQCAVLVKHPDAHCPLPVLTACLAAISVRYWQSASALVGCVLG